jgi:hypothetical protein
MKYYYLRRNKQTGEIFFLYAGSYYNDREAFLSHFNTWKRESPDRDYIEIPESCVRRIYGDRIFSVDDYILWTRPWPG